MVDLAPETLRVAIELLDQLRSGLLEDEESGSVVVRLNALLPDPHWFSYAIDYEPELSSEAVVRRAFEYKPIQLYGPAQGNA